MKTYFKLVAAAVFAGGFIAPAAMAAPGDKVGESQMCVEAHDIDQSPVINRTTVLLKMRSPSEGYRRMELGKNCSIDRGTGFAWSSSVGKLCTSDTLRLTEGSGQFCVINKIVTIDKQEADSLLKQKFN